MLHKVLEQLTKGKKLERSALQQLQAFPSKPLGCYGDGGCIFTDDEELNSILRSLRMHGQGTHKYDTVRVGFNSQIGYATSSDFVRKIANIT